MIAAKGFAVASFGVLDVTTVSPTRRGAIVNWLVAGPPRRFIYQWTTDDEIERHWRECCGGFDDHKVVEVEIAAMAA